MKYKFAPAFICDFFTPFYDLIIKQGGLGKSLEERIIKIANIKDGESILDVGCGSGGLVVRIRSNYQNCEVVGVDPDQKILNLAKKKIEKNKFDVALINAWAEKLPFQNSSFDIVISALTFHHLPTEIKKQSFKEIHRVLKKDGRFLLADIGKPDSLFWKVKFAIDPERLFSTGEYMKDNLGGRLPLFVEDAGFAVKEIYPKYRGVQFLLARK